MYQRPAASLGGSPSLTHTLPPRFTTRFVKPREVSMSETQEK